MSFLSHIFLSLVLVVQGFFGSAQQQGAAALTPTSTVSVVARNPQATTTTVEPAVVPNISVGNPVRTPAPIAPQPATKPASVPIALPVAPPIPKTFTTPSGAVLDASGNVIQAAPQSSSQPIYQPTQSAPIQQNNAQAAAQAQVTAQINALIGQCNSQMSAYEQQIAEVKTQYYTDAANAATGKGDFSGGDTIEYAQVLLQQKEALANQKIAQIQLQEAQLQQTCQENLAKIQSSQY